jgi:Leucine-rich repeat (LRR) protein
MFIKKDLRKIPRIFADASKADDEELTELRLARRPAEFNGSISALCQPQFASSLRKLTSLSLYECQISNLEGMEFFAQSCPNLEKMNLGMNPLSSLPDSIGLIQSLKGIWLDDCQIEGEIPACLSRLENLQVLRMSNNRISELNDDTVKRWKDLEVLCLDGNLITSVPQEIANLTKLEKLLLR